jgi:hypothetical protein
MLNNLAIQYGTDKSSITHNYTKMYEQFMNQDRLEVLKVLEIGLGNGASARMWKDYFPNATIYVIENFGDENKNIWNGTTIHEDRIIIINGSQDDFNTWNKVPYNLDFVIDDGSHIPEHQITSVNLGFEKLKSGGVWFIEDTHCNFHRNYSDKDKIYPWLYGLIVQQQIPEITTEGDFYKIRNILQGLNKDIIAFHLYKSVIALEKA